MNGMQDPIPPANRLRNLASSEIGARGESAQSVISIKRRVHADILDNLSDEEHDRLGKLSLQDRYARLDSMVSEVLDRERSFLPQDEKSRLIRELADRILGLGPLEALLHDSSVTEIMVNDFNKIFVERDGLLVESDLTFDDRADLLRVIERIVSTVGRRIDESSPLVDARLLDGSRVNAVIPPLATLGPSLTIRKFSEKPLLAEDLLRYGTCTGEMMDFIRAAVVSRLNVLVAGGTGSGKTTTLNALASFIPVGERVVTIEDTAELRLSQPNWVALEARPANVEGRGEFTIRDLVKNSLRMRPNRIIVGEVRAGEALDMLQAMNTGHDGSLTTVHANSPRDAVSRLATMVLMSGMELPLRAVLEQIASALDIIVYQARLADGTRKITGVSEIVGLHDDVVEMRDIYAYVPEGIDENKRAIGHFEYTGYVPQCMKRFRESGVRFDFPSLPNQGSSGSGRRSV